MNLISDFGLKVVKQNNRYAVCHCPIHNDTHASALVYLDNMWFVCFVCHISKPLESLLKDAGLDSSGVVRTPSIDDIDLMEEVYKTSPLSDDALKYLSDRGVTGNIPSYIFSPKHNKGVAFGFTKSNGEIVGAQVRLFPYNVASTSWRYTFEGRRLPWFGNIAPHYKLGYKLFVFEKAFATLKAEMAARQFDLPVAAISAVGSHYQSGLLDITNIDTTFFFDADGAGMTAAQGVKKKTGARVIIPAKPLDELTITEMGKYLEKYLA